jgi:hypothetical protein
VAEEDRTERPEQEPRRLTLAQVIGGVLAAMFGVRSERMRERDFTAGRPGQFIIVGIAMTLLFILIVYGVVQLVVHLAGR